MKILGERNWKFYLYLFIFCWMLVVFILTRYGRVRTRVLKVKNGYIKLWSKIEGKCYGRTYRATPLLDGYSLKNMGEVVLYNKKLFSVEVFYRSNTAIQYVAKVGPQEYIWGNLTLTKLDCQRFKPTYPPWFNR